MSTSPWPTSSSRVYIAQDPVLHEIGYGREQEHVGLPDVVGKLDCGSDGSSPSQRTLKRRTARQAARSVLPNATGRRSSSPPSAALRHFFVLRGGHGADPEIREGRGAHVEIKSVEAPNLSATSTSSIRRRHARTPPTTQV